MEATVATFNPPHIRFAPTAFTPEQQALVELESQITELWGYLNAATYRFLCLIGEYDRRKAYERHGLVNTAQWLNWQCGIGTVAAREKVRVARALEKLPKVSAAFANGEVSYSKVREITRVATPANEAALVMIARHGTASHVEKLVRKYRWTQRRDAGKLAHGQFLNRAVHCFYEADDTFVLHARLPPEVGALVQKALQTASDLLRARDRTASNVPAGTSDAPPQTPFGRGPGIWGIEDEEFSAAAKRADALRLIAETFLACRSEEVEATSSADRYQLVVHVDQAVLTDEASAQENEPHRSELDAGPALALDTVRRLGCDGTIVGILEGRDGEPLNIGRKTRSIPPAIARALRARDGGCRFPGCDRTRFTQGHHVKHWADGGDTKLGNLVSLCHFHHTLVHEGGFGVTATDDGAFVFTRPDGQRIPDSGGPLTARSANDGECSSGNFADLDPGKPQDLEVDGPPEFDPLERSLRRYLRTVDVGLRIDAKTIRCKWLGERMDYSFAIEGLQCLRDRAAPA